MKSFRLFTLISVALICAFAFAIAPVAASLLEPTLGPIVFSVAILGAATVLAIRHLLLPTASNGRSGLVRLAFPAPQTGTPLASAFA